MTNSTLTPMRFLGSRAVFTVTATAFLLLPFEAHADKYDDQLRALLDEQGIYVPDSGLPAEPDADMILLGQALFFDHELSGNRDVACATCHHPSLATGDALSLSVGTGAVVKGALGPLRQRGPGRKLIPRNAPEIFNRGSTLWRTQYWDSRVAVSNSALATRLLTIPGYRQMFSDAYGIADADLDNTVGFGHAAKAIATFEAEAFTFLDSPFDRYLDGDNNALSK